MKTNYIKFNITSQPTKLVFEFRTGYFMYFLSKTRKYNINKEILRKYRKFALVGVLILSAIITPPDIASQVIVAIPIIVLYQISIYISKGVVKSQERKERKLKKRGTV